MATRKLNLVYDGFIKGIGDRWETAFDPMVDANIPDSNLMTKEVITNYVNRALWQLFDSIWLQVRGDKEKFISIFPELLKTTAAISVDDAGYTIASPYLDLHTLYDAYGSNNSYMVVLPENLFTTVKSGNNRSYIGSTTKPIVIKVANKIYTFPTPETNRNVYALYISSPVNPTTGQPLEQNGDYDINFAYHWIDKLCQIAIDLYKQASQETT